jgi:AraC-like DNA-binding protein
MAFIGGGVLHGGTPEGLDCVYDCAVFDLALLSRSIEDPVIAGILRDRIAIKPVLSFTDSRSTWEAVVRLMDSLKNLTEPSDRLICLGILYEVFGRVIGGGLYKENTEDPGDDIRRWKKLLYYIEEHYSEKISIDDLAKMACLSRSTFIRRFNRVCKMPPADYIMKQRIDVAENFLINTGTSLADIAFKCGFYDAAHLSHTFKKIKGLSPLEYRKKTQK